MSSPTTIIGSSFWNPPQERYIPTTCSAWWSLASPPLPSSNSTRLQFKRWLQDVIHLLWDLPQDMMSLLWQYAQYRVCLDVSLRADALSNSWPLDKLYRGCVTVQCQLKVLQCFLQRQNCVIHHSNHGSCTEYAGQTPRTTAARSPSGSRRRGRTSPTQPERGAGVSGAERRIGGCRSGDGLGCYELSLCKPVFHPEGKLTLHTACCCPQRSDKHDTFGVCADTLVELARLL